ncbi:hypothetical protein WOB59_00455 [Methylocystis sp. IM4]|uniref:hypothetical protein n=1 Tax=Methylocystis sp. IM4 TaxID=3136560 RepID=UPI00311A1EF9
MASLRNTFQRLSRALKYGFNQLSAQDAQQIIGDCGAPAGWHPLMVLSVDDALRHVLETYVDHPSLRRLVSRACSDIERKCGGGALKDDTAAKEWASKLARTYAREEGLILTKWEDVLPKRMFDRSAAPAPVPAPHHPEWRLTTAELPDHFDDSAIPFEGATRCLDGDQILAAALGFVDMPAAAE